MLISTTFVSWMRLADSTMLFARGPHPPRFEPEVASSGAGERAVWPGASSRSSITSKPERLTHPRMSRTAKSFLHMRRIIHRMMRLVKGGLCPLMTPPKHDDYGKCHDLIALSIEGGLTSKPRLVCRRLINVHGAGMHTSKHYSKQGSRGFDIARYSNMPIQT